MKDRLLHIYDWFASRHRWLWGLLVGVLVPLVVLAATLHYNEDIMDFLPATQEERDAFQQFQSQQAAARLYLIIEGDNLREDALYACADRIPELQWDTDDLLEQLYAQLPCLIEDSIYDRLDSVFTPQAIRAALERDKTILATPGASAFASAIRHDPLGLVQLNNYQSQIANKSFAFLDTRYGATETKNNAALVDSLTAITDEISQCYPNLEIRWTGAPVIAVGNARRIKTDSLLCIALSLVLIIALMTYAFPRKRDICLILFAVTFGWLTGMAVLRIVTPEVSAIVLGIGSVLIGIAVNYPLHLLVHQRYTTSVRQTLEQVLAPLLIGNITTVAAFLALVPLHAAAMKQLGLFAAAMLLGTIIFCIFFMPHFMDSACTPVRDIKIKPIFKSPIRNSKFTISRFQWLVLSITLLLGAYVCFTPADRFDNNLTHINYMTPQQRNDMAAFESGHGDGSRWTTYWQTHNPQATVGQIQKEAIEMGFKPDAFAPFYETLTDWHPTQPFGFSQLTKRLSDDFDYIGLCCSLIVFIFLWISFRNFWLALIAFAPMAFSWVWILALMQLLGLQFNIVNVILATFIFGQGDDYTIFILEGLIYEHRYGKQILPQYRQSILLSALIMLLGIGILAFAVHPAMHSLGILTLLGMAIVLLMALTITPLLFRIYTTVTCKTG